MKTPTARQPTRYAIARLCKTTKLASAAAWWAILVELFIIESHRVDGGRIHVARRWCDRISLRYMMAATMLNKFAIVMIVAAAAIAAGRGSASASVPANTSGGAQTAAPKAETAASLPDPCALLSPSDVQLLIGNAKPANPGASQTAAGGPQFRSCTWGDLTDPAGLVSVMVSVTDKESQINYADILVGASGRGGTTVSVGSDGKLFADRAIIAGGGGTGKTILFHKNGVAIVVAVTGTRISQTALVTAAQGAANKR